VREGLVGPSTDGTALPGPESVEPRVHDTIAFSSRRKWSAAVLDEETWLMGAPEILFAGADGGPELLVHAQRLSTGGVMSPIKVVVAAASPMVEEKTSTVSPSRNPSAT